jgi:hypothetical protein
MIDGRLGRIGKRIKSRSASKSAPSCLLVHRPSRIDHSRGKANPIRSSGDETNPTIVGELQQNRTQFRADDSSNRPPFDLGTSIPSLLFSFGNGVGNSYFLKFRGTAFETKWGGQARWSGLVAPWWAG